MTETYFGALLMWERFQYYGALYMKNSVSSAVNLDTNTQIHFDVRTKVQVVRKGYIND